MFKLRSEQITQTATQGLVVLIRISSENAVQQPSNTGTVKMKFTLTAIVNTTAGLGNSTDTAAKVERVNVSKDQPTLCGTATNFPPFVRVTRINSY